MVACNKLSFDMFASRCNLVFWWACGYTYGNSRFRRSYEAKLRVALTSV